MDSISSSSAAIAAASAGARSTAESNIATALAAKLLLAELERGHAVNAQTLRTAMTAGFGSSDAEGAWDWKTAYDACEAAQVLFLRRFGPAMRARAGSPPTLLPMLAKIAALLPSHTRRSEESQALQQFSTPITLGFVASIAAAMTAADLVLEPSAGTGLLAIFAELAGAGLVLNELTDTRADVLAHLFPAFPVTRHDAAHIHDYLDKAVRPSVVLMNPPFSVAANVDGRVADAALRHISSALVRLADRGRLVAITGASLSPDNPAWRGAFITLQERGRVVFSAAIDGRVYARHGTTTDTRLTVIDRVPADDPTIFPPSPGEASDTSILLDWVTRLVPPRPAIAAMAPGRMIAPVAKQALSTRPVGHVRRPVVPVTAVETTGVELSYEVTDWTPAETGGLTEALYEPYTLQSIRISGSKPHPTRLVQSAAMASVAPPKPSYRPHLQPHLVSDGLLSDAQLESVIYAGEAHSGYLAGSWTVDDTFDVVSAAPDDAEHAVRFRRGWFLGDGTGAGKGRQVAGILLDNWLKGRHRAVWVSKSDKLIEDARRDWSALGQERLLIVPLARFRQGTPIRLSQGILFTTYATLRSDVREERVSRVRQIVDWLGRDFDGVIVFDESHAMQNAAGQTSERGDHIELFRAHGFSIAALMKALASTPRHFGCAACRSRLRPQLYVTLFGLIAATGLRTSEALRLRLGDILPGGVLRITETKFNKSRLVPLHGSVVAALDRYLAVRRRLGTLDDHLFVGRDGKQLAFRAMQQTFVLVVRLANIAPDRSRRPRITDLRHTFATRALQQCATRPQAVSRHFVALSTYLGHTNIKHTYWYLQAIPELMTDMAAQAEALLAGRRR